MFIRIIKKQEDNQLIQHFYPNFTRKFDDRVTVDRFTNQSRNGSSNAFFDTRSFASMLSCENDGLSDDELAVQRNYATPMVHLTLSFEPKPEISSLSTLFEDIRQFLSTELLLNEDEYVLDSNEPPSNSSFMTLS